MRIRLLIVLLGLLKINNANAQYKIPTSYEEVNYFATNWCKCYFNDCFSGREFKKIFSISNYDEMHDSNGDYEFVEGKLHYYNYLDIIQSVIFQMKIYSDRTIFYKQSISVSSGKLEWEKCSKLRGYCK